MKIGMNFVTTSDTADIGSIAKKCEEVGFDSIWVGEHPLFPLDTTTRYPMRDDGEFPDYYTSLADPLIGLAMAAAVTKKLKLCTSICLVNEHNLFTLTKAVGTLDAWSDGRVILGIGSGYIPEELDIATGVAWADRYNHLRESVEAMRLLWNEGDAEYHGSLVDFPLVRVRPQPKQRPVPVVIGGVGDITKKQVARWADGWCPTVWVGPEDFALEAKQVRDMAAEFGRDPKAIEISILLGVTDASDLESLVTAYGEAGADRVVLVYGQEEAPNTFRSYHLPTRDRYEGMLEGLARRARAFL